MFTKRNSESSAARSLNFNGEIGWFSVLYCWLAVELTLQRHQRPVANLAMLMLEAVRTVSTGFYCFAKFEWFEMSYHFGLREKTFDQWNASVFDSNFETRLKKQVCSLNHIVLATLAIRQLAHELKNYQPFYHLTCRSISDCLKSNKIILLVKELTGLKKNHTIFWSVHSSWATQRSQWYWPIPACVRLFSVGKTFSSLNFGTDFDSRQV